MQKLKLSDIKSGDIIVADDGFDCMKPGPHKVEEDRDGSLYVVCNGDKCDSDGYQKQLADGTEKHFLDGQLDGAGYLVGFARLP